MGPTVALTYARTVSDLRVLARTLRGLEWIAGAEVQATLSQPEIAYGHRELRFSVPDLSPQLLALGTVDDVFLVAATAGGLGRARESLAKLAALAEVVDLDSYASMLGRSGSFDVVGSFVGKRNFSRFEIEDAFGAALAAATGWTYESRSGGQPARGNLSLRVHLVDSEATVAVRIAKVPLHRRVYRVASRPGSLHPPLARALALLAGLRPAATLVDPFCGTGTIAIEAKLACPELQASASDLDPEAVDAARRNAAAAGIELELAVRDAGELPAADRVATNPPWEEAVATAGRVRLDPSSFATRLQEVGRSVVLTPPETKLEGVVLENRVRVSGALAAILVLGDRPVDEGGLYGDELKRALAVRDELSEAASSPTSR